MDADVVDPEHRQPGLRQARRGQCDELPAMQQVEIPRHQRGIIAAAPEFMRQVGEARVERRAISAPIPLAPPVMSARCPVS